MQRALLHFLLLCFGIMYMSTPSTLIYVFPTWVVSFLASIRNKNERFDVIDMFWLLNQLSFVVAPLVTLREDGEAALFASGVIVPLSGDSFYSYSQSVVTELYFMIFLVSLINFVFLPRTYRYERKKNFEIRFSTAQLILLFTIAVALEILMRGGLANTLAARRFKEDALGGVALILFRTLTLAVSLFLASKLKTERSWVKLPGYILLFGFMLILYNPFNAPRFLLLEALMPIILITFPFIGLFRNFSIMLFGGMVFIMPILSETTRVGTNASIENVNFSPEFFLGYLDQHKVLMHLIYMVRNEGYQFGHSTISVLLFFVPRSIWPDKPLVLGLEVGNELYGMGLVGTENLSGPIFGDLYYDFGLIGVALGGCMVAYAFRRLLVFGETINGIPALGILVMSTLPILFRGTVGAIIGPFIFTLFFYYALLFIQKNIRLGKS